MKHQIICKSNTCPDRHNCQIYDTEKEESKTEPDDKPNAKCEFFKKKGGKE